MTSTAEAIELNGGVRPDCECHGAPMYWQADSRRTAGYWRCATKQREACRRWHATNYLVSKMRRLAKGLPIMKRSHHHQAMALLKAELGDPRPNGMTLSLVGWDSPAAYWGFTTTKGERRPYRLSTDPDDYIWESLSDNIARDAHRRASS